LFESPKARKFEHEWRSVFADYGGNCHWVDLIHRREMFEGVGDRRDDLIKRAIPILGDRIECGVIAACNIRDAAEFALDTDGYRTAYGLCCWRAMDLMCSWYRERGRKQRIQYVFESGHAHEAEARRILQDIGSDPILLKDYFFSGSSFVRKSECLLLQAPDALAWEAVKFKLETVDRLKTPGVRSPRGSWKALFNGRREKFAFLSISRKTLAHHHKRLSDDMATRRPDELGPRRKK
jgi:hypothetical protein